MRFLEDAIQIQCVTWFRVQYPKALVFAIPNGGKRNAREGLRLKMAGVTPGVPDLFIPALSLGGPMGLFVELKAGKNRSTDAQIDMQSYLEGVGYWMKTCRSLDEFRADVTLFMGAFKKG